MHTGNVPGYLIGIDAGRIHSSNAFVQHYQLAAPFNIDCVGCCWDYLVNARQYQPYYDNFNYVKFSHNPAHVSMYVDGPELAIHSNGKIKTDYDHNLGHPGPRTVKQGHSYQIYVPPNQAGPDQLALGKQATVRIEAIAVPKLKGCHELDGCYFNYCDAALLELYRAREKKTTIRWKEFAAQCSHMMIILQGNLIICIFEIIIRCVICSIHDNRKSYCFCCLTLCYYT